MYLNIYGINLSDSIKMLGTKIDKSLSWCAHIEDVCKRLSSIVFALGILVQIYCLEVLTSVYFACFQSIMKNGICFWGRFIDMIRVFIIQKRAIRATIGISFRESCGSVFERMGILAYPSLYTYNVLCLGYRNRSILSSV